MSLLLTFSIHSPSPYSSLVPNPKKDRNPVNSKNSAKKENKTQWKMVPEARKEKPESSVLLILQW